MQGLQEERAARKLTQATPLLSIPCPRGTHIEAHTSGVLHRKGCKQCVKEAKAAFHSQAASTHSLRRSGQRRK